MSKGIESKVKFKKPKNQSAAEDATRVTLPVLDSIKGLTSEQRDDLTAVLIQLGYDDPIRTMARLGSRMFSVLNGLYVNVTGNAVGGEEGFPLLEAYQRAQKLEVDKKVRGKEG